MRNLFDQYSQNENKLTHALVSSLYEDKILLKEFVRWATGVKSPSRKIEVIEQQLVGDEAESEFLADQKGLPDAWFYDDATWSLLLESKVAATLTRNQLERHYKTALRRGFTDITVLTITIAEPSITLPKYVKSLTWIDCFRWLKSKEPQSPWAGRAAGYMRAVESKWIAEGYLIKGALTVFTGIPFTENNPYNYLEAKLCLKQLMEELRKEKDLARELGADLKALGRGGITGAKAEGVWDFIPLKRATTFEEHTKYPHMTITMGQEFMTAIAILPSGMQRAMWKKIQSLSEEEFTAVLAEINKRFAPILRKAPDATPRIGVTQRHFPSRRSQALEDAKLSYDLRAVFPSKSASAIKHQPEWAIATYLALANKNSNMTFNVGLRIPYGDGKITNSKAIVGFACDTWIACKPLFDVVLKK
jgi:hypothetical protein